MVQDLIFSLKYGMLCLWYYSVLLCFFSFVGRLKMKKLMFIAAMLLMIFATGCRAPVRVNSMTQTQAQTQPTQQKIHRNSLQYALAQVKAKSEGVKKYGVVACVDSSLLGGIGQRVAANKAGKMALLKKVGRKRNDLRGAAVDTRYRHKLEFRDGTIIRASVLPKYPLFDSFMGEVYSCYRFAFNIYLQR